MAVATESIGYAASLAGASVGTVAQIRSISIDGLGCDALEFTNMDSTSQYDEYMGGIKRAGEITVECVFKGSIANTVIAAIGNAEEAWTVTFNDKNDLASDSKIVLHGFITNVGIAIPHDDMVTQSITIKCGGMTAAPAWTAATD